MSVGCVNNALHTDVWCACAHHNKAHRHADLSVSLFPLCFAHVVCCRIFFFFVSSIYSSCSMPIYLVTNDVCIVIVLFNSVQWMFVARVLVTVFFLFDSQKLALNCRLISLRLFFFICFTVILHCTFYITIWPVIRHVHTKPMQMNRKGSAVAHVVHFSHLLQWEGETSSISLLFSMNLIPFQQVRFDNYDWFHKLLVLHTPFSICILDICVNFFFGNYPVCLSTHAQCT